MRRLKSKGGFTLTETLICVVLLALMSAAGAVASGVVISTRNGMIETADAQVLGSTALEALTQEIRYGRHWSVKEDKSFTADSNIFGAGMTITLDEQGKIKAGSYELLADYVYSSGLKVSKLEFSEEGGGIKISIAVAGGSGKDIWTGDVTVMPMNPQ